MNYLEMKMNLKEKIANVCTLKNVMLEHLYHKPLLNAEEIFNTINGIQRDG